jgi:predicted phage-related endonuclease
VGGDAVSLLDTLGLSPEALAKRRHSIGGSDANAIMSGDADKLIRLWREKRGEAEPEDLSDVLAVQMGSFTEPLNVAWFEKQTGLRVTQRGLVLKRESHGVPMHATLDGYVAREWPEDGEINGEELGIWEAKHCGVRNTDAELFERYVPQLTHNCICADERRAFLSVFKGNGDWMMMEYELDDAYAAALIEAERDFWRCVQTGEPPAPLPLPPAPKPAGIVEYDMSQSNEWASHCVDYLDTILAADRHETAKKALKELVPADASRCFARGVEIKRDKRGALRFATYSEEKAA